MPSLASKNVVILLHGFAAHRSLLAKLKKHLDGAGFTTINWGYNSWFKSIDRHADQLRNEIHRLDQDHRVKSIHFVTHSMGCIVTRSALHRTQPHKQGRWVMLAPPNKGSYLANVVPSMVKSWMKPLEELQTTETSYVNRLPMPQNIEVAVVQASWDYIVAPSLTHVDEAKDRLVVPGLHSQLLFRKDVAEQTIHFLRHGRFSAQADVAQSVTRKCS